MEKLTDLLGKKFEKLTVLERLRTSTKSRTKWLCQCDCGGITETTRYNLIYNKARSCGCLRRGSCGPGIEGLTESFFNKIAYNAKKRNIDFDISLEYAWNKFILQDKKCALTGIDLNFRSGSKKYDGTASLDRKDSSLGYVKENIQWIHKKINIIKNDISQEDFINLCKLVTEYQNGNITS